MKSAVVFLFGILLLISGCTAGAPVEQFLATPTTAMIATSTPSPTPSATPTKTLTPTITNTSTQTPTETKTSTPIPEPFTKLEDLKPLLSEEEQAKILLTFQKINLGSWELAKEWSNRDAKWIISIASEGELIDLVEKPLQIAISEDENVNMLVGIRGYYPDMKGELQSILAPVVMEFSDGTIYYSGGLLMEPRVDWKKNEIMQKVKEYGVEVNTSVNESKGVIINIHVIPDFDITEELWLKEFGRIDEESGYAYLHNSVLKPYIEHNIDLLKDFLESGDPSIGVIIPQQMSNTFRYFPVDFDK